MPAPAPMPNGSPDERPRRTALPGGGARRPGLRARAGAFRGGQGRRDLRAPLLPRHGDPGQGAHHPAGRNRVRRLLAPDRRGREEWHPRTGDGGGPARRGEPESALPWPRSGGYVKVAGREEDPASPALEGGAASVAGSSSRLAIF